MIIHTKKYSTNKYVQGRGLISSNNRRYVHGRGFLDQLFPMALEFARNPESAVNVGKAVTDLGTSGFNIGKSIKDGVSISKIKGKPDIMKMIDEIKGIHIGKGFCKI